ncbi:MAG: hypothetical protein HWE14_06965 [Flavobacteriia bacterium]|nr:hypothetical protein [Flavobacteriia bacterium]
MNSLLSDYKKFRGKADKYVTRPSKRSKYIQYSNKAGRIKFQIFSSWIEEFENHDYEFKRLAERNRELLYGLDFKAVTKTSGVSLFGTYSSDFSGRIRPDGILLAKADRIGGFFNSPSTYFRRYSGEIDCLGHFSFEGVGTDLSLFKSLPKSYTVRTLRPNKIQFTTQKRETELFRNGKDFVKEIMGRPFNNREAENEFLKNREAMYLELERKFQAVIQ